MASGLAWRGTAVGVSGRTPAMSMNAARRASARSSPRGVGRSQAGKSAGAFDVGERRFSYQRGDRRGVVTRAMLSFDENDSGDDYEFDENFGLRAPKRERLAFEAVEWHGDTAQRRAKDVLDVVDKSGVWTVGTTGGALLITAFDSLFDSGTVDPVALSVLAPDWIVGSGVDAANDASFLYRTLAGLYVDPSVVASAETTLQGIFLFEFCLRAWAERFRFSYLKSPVALVDFAAILPSIDVLLFGGIGGSSASAALRPLRLFRLLRLLRLLDAASDEKGEKNKPGVGDKVASVAVEFLCVFLISGELFYDLEYEVNPAISDVGDALYWSFLTLTGIGQPFEAVTAQGRVATVGSILTALVVVPLQLAKIVGANQESESSDASFSKARAFVTDPRTVNGIGVQTVTSSRASRGAEREERSPAFGLPDDPPFAAESDVYARSTSGSGFPNVADPLDPLFADGSPRMDDPPRNTRQESTFAIAVNASAFETFDSVDEAYAAEVYGLNETSTTETDPEATRSGAAYASVTRELADARARLRAFEDEVDTLRAENAALRAVVTRRRIKDDAERRA
jgi:hypothetical protein